MNTLAELQAEWLAVSERTDADHQYAGHARKFAKQLTPYLSLESQLAASVARGERLAEAFKIAHDNLKRFAKSDNWKLLWPKHCRKCEGAGGWSSMDRDCCYDGGPCSCVEDEKCPRCGKDWPDCRDGPENETCPHCSWNAVKPDCCPSSEIDPFDWERMEEARTLLETP